jgi:hypothetical protein
MEEMRYAFKIIVGDVKGSDKFLVYFVTLSAARLCNVEWWDLVGSSCDLMEVRSRNFPGGTEEYKERTQSR